MKSALKDYTIKNEELKTIFPKYIEHIKNNKKMTSVFNYAAELGLFSHFEVENVVFQVRHPVHSYLSFAKPERHKAKIDYYGGIKSIRAMEYYCIRWNALVTEYLRLIELGLPAWLLRYEFIENDINQLKELKWIYRDFDSSRRNNRILDQESENEFKSMVSIVFYKIYENWEI